MSKNKKILFITLVILILLLGFGQATFNRITLLEVRTKTMDNGSIELTYGMENDTGLNKVMEQQECMIGYAEYYNDFMQKNDCYADSSKGKKDISCNTTYEEYQKISNCTPSRTASRTVSMDVSRRFKALKVDETSLAKYNRVYAEDANEFFMNIEYGMFIVDFNGKVTLLGFADKEQQVIKTFWFWEK